MGSSFMALSNFSMASSLSVGVLAVGQGVSPRAVGP